MEIYKTVSDFAFSLAGAGLVICIILWFKFNILRTISDLSGMTAKKSIKQMRSKNERAVNSKYLPGVSVKEPILLKEDLEHKDIFKNKSVVNETHTLTELSITESEMLMPETELLMNETDKLKTEDNNKEYKIKLIKNIMLINTEEVIKF